MTALPKDMPKHTKTIGTRHTSKRRDQASFLRVFVLCLCVLIICIVGAIVLWPLLQPGFFVTDDGEWMVIRLSAFYQSLSTGQFPVRFLGRLNHSYGYPVANFLYPGFLYVGSILRLIGFSFVDAVKIIMGGSVVVGAVSIFAALRVRYRLISSTVATLHFLTTPYLLYDMYHRGSVGEVFAIGITTIALYAIVASQAWILAPIIGLLVISHNTLALIMVGAIVLFIAATKEKRSGYFLSVLLGVGMSAFFWMPALIEKQFVKFDLVVVSDALSYMINSSSAWLLGGATLAACLVYASLRRSMHKEERISFWFTLFGLFMAVPFSSPLWGSALSQLVQFPYRFLSLTIVFGPFVVASVIDRLNGWHKGAMIVLLVLVWQCTVVLQLQRINYVERPITYYTTNEATTTVADEYMPRWVSTVPDVRSVETIEVLDGDIEISERTFLGEKIAATIEAREESIIAINKLYYPGWGVALDQVSIPIDYRNDTGTMRITIPKGTHHLVAQFRETPTRFIADLISVFGFIVYLMYVRRVKEYI